MDDWFDQVQKTIDNINDALRNEQVGSLKKDNRFFSGLSSINHTKSKKNVEKRLNFAVLWILLTIVAVFIIAFFVIIFFFKA